VNLLAIDTTSDFGSIALLNDRIVVEEVAIHSPDGFAHVIFQEIDRLLRRHSVQISNLDGFASASGPGSFTGVRMGLTAAKGLAESCRRRMVAVSNLEALAWFGTRALRAPVIDARRGEIYGAVYDTSGNVVQSEVVSKLDAWIGLLPGGDLELIPRAVDLPLIPFPVTRAPRELARAVGAIAVDRFARGLAIDPAEADANYVRRSDAELFWRDG
jgi:tRNA threonylcarbamoyladenosine biosynthesis protein TsaB